MTPGRTPGSPFGRGRLDLTGLRRNTSTTSTSAGGANVTTGTTSEGVKLDRGTGSEADAGNIPSEKGKGKEKQPVPDHGSAAGSGSEAESRPGPLSVPSPFLAMSPNASPSKASGSATGATGSAGPRVVASATKPIPTTPTKARQTAHPDPLLSPSRSRASPLASTSDSTSAPASASAGPIAPSPSRRGNASPMHNSLLKAKAEMVRRAGFAAIDERDEDEEEDEDELALGTRSSARRGADGGSPSKRRKFQGQGIDLESAIKSSHSISGRMGEEPTSPSSSKRKLREGLMEREVEPVRPTVDMLQLVLPPGQASISSASATVAGPAATTAMKMTPYLVSPYVSIHHPPLTYSGISNHVLPSALDRIFAKTVPSAEYAWGPSFLMQSKGGHGYVDRDENQQGDEGRDEEREMWKRLDMADKRKRRAEKRRRRVLKHLQKGLEVPREDDDAGMGVDDDQGRKKRRVERPRWEREFGMEENQAGNGLRVEALSEVRLARSLPCGRFELTESSQIRCTMHQARLRRSTENLVQLPSRGIRSKPYGWQGPKVKGLP